MFNKKILVVVLSAFARSIHAEQPFISKDVLTTEVTNYSRALSTSPAFDSVVYNGLIQGMTKNLYPGGNNVIYVADLGNRKVLKFDDQFNLILSFGESGTDGQFDGVIDVAVDKYHNVYVGYSGSVRKCDGSENYLLTFNPPTPMEIVLTKYAG